MRRASAELSDPARNLADSNGSPPPSTMPNTMKEEEEEEEGNHDLDLISEDSPSTRIHTPPPRIAARFYKPTNSRRKSSAASSRRNSISSAHSHTSSHRHVSGSQSNYIAQHLRRASIIEDRKARLADRAAHAEKVRLRAALAKAAPRSTSNTEERALAAQQAREKNLAEIVASCAEEVKRAKGIAESMKEKRELEGKKLRREMEERLAEAERRREEILNRGVGAKRGRSTSQARKSVSPTREAVVKKAISVEVAVSRIQQRWRIHRKWKAVKDFADLGLTIDGVRETTFEKVVDLLAQEKVLVSTAHILRICGLKEGESGSVNEMTAVRTFLSAFLILGHPTQVLSSKAGNGEQEQVGVLPMRRDDLANPQLQDLVAKARDLLISFENVLSRLNAANNYTPPPAQLSTLSEVYATFFNAFIAWKARDSSTLIDMMVLQFVELDSIWQTVKDSTEEAVTDSYRDGIRENQLKLMVRIKRLAGAAQGKKLITNAIREARKSKTTKKPTGDSKPRAAEAGPSSPVMGDVHASEHVVNSQLQTLTPPPTPRREELQSSGAERLRTASSMLPDNRTLVHELAINREYRIEIGDCWEHKNALNQLIFDSMRKEVSSGVINPWILAMAENIKGKLHRLLKPGNSMYTLIDEALDPDLVARELRSGAFSYEKFFSFMSTILPRLCAPFRDEEVKALIETSFQTGDFVDRLQALLAFIDEMLLDYANFMLQQGAPELIKNAAQYEAKHFSEDMRKNNNQLPFTTEAWIKAREKVFAEAARRDPENVGLARNRPTPEKTYIHMLVEVCTSVSPSTPIPETLTLDTKRIIRMRADILRIITTSAILLQSKNLLKRDVRSQWKTEAGRIFSVLENSKGAEQAESGIQAALESSRSMPSATKNHIRELVRKIVAAAAAAGEEGVVNELREPVMKLLHQRVKSYLIGRLAKERVGPLLPTNASSRETSPGVGVGGIGMGGVGTESLGNLGMPEFVGRIGVIVEMLGNVGRVDRESHGSVYEVVEGLAVASPSA